MNNSCFSFSEDFSVADEHGRSYGLIAANDTALSHHHGWIEDGVYRIPVDGNRHFVAVPPLKDFHLEADYTLVPYSRLDMTLGFKVFFRHDPSSREGHEISVFYDRYLKLHFALDGADIFVRNPVPGSEVKDLPLENQHLILDVKGTDGLVETMGAKVSFALPADKCRCGKIAFDLTLNESVKLLIKRLEVTSNEAPAVKPIGKWHIVLPRTQGFVNAAVYDVTADRYESSETRVTVKLSGLMPDRPKRFETGGGEWTIMSDRVTSPYVKLTLQDGTERKLYIWNGLKVFQDMWKKTSKLPCEWPLEKSFLLPDIGDKFLVAAGYENAITHPWRFAANGPFEMVLAENGDVVHVGQALGPGIIAFSASSPADKKIVSLIPANLPKREQALKHAREQHYFFESEKPQFTISAIFRKTDFTISELKVVPRVEDVYGELTDIGLEQICEHCEELAGGYLRLKRTFALSKNPGVGVWHLECEIGAEPDTRTERTVFEVLSEDPASPSPALVSGLPELLSVPNEIKYLEESAFDPWSDLGGVAHYYSIDMRYPAIGERLHAWEADHIYRRKYFTWCGSRNSGNYNQQTEECRNYMRHADYYGGYPDGKHREGRFDLPMARTYVRFQLQVLEDFLKERNLTLKTLPEDVLVKCREEAKGIPDAVIEELFTLCWNDFKAYAKKRIEVYIKEFVDYLLSVNPKLARASYGPMPVYTAVFKTPYFLEYCSHPLDDDPRIRANGSFWLLEDYHYSCDYPLYRPAYFAAGYCMLHPQGRRLFPEIYYQGWGRCADGAVYQAHPDKYVWMADEHQRRIVYQYGYGTAYLKDGKYGYWTDYGFHARNPQKKQMDQFIYAWGKLKKNRPARPIKSPYVIVDPDAFRRFGDFFEKRGAFDLRAPGFDDERSDICNLAEEAVSYTYERCCVEGYSTPVITTLESLDLLMPDNCDFIVLPPLTKDTPSEIIAAVRRALVRGVKIIGFIEACGLEAELTEFVKDAPTLAGRDRFFARYSRGREALDPATAADIKHRLSALAPAPAAKTERGNLITCETVNGDIVAIISETSPLYGDSQTYPVSFRFTLRVPGIGKRTVEADAPWSYVEHTDDTVTIRTSTGKDTAIFFKFTAPARTCPNNQLGYNC